MSKQYEGNKIPYDKMPVDEKADENWKTYWENPDNRYNRPSNKSGKIPTEFQCKILDKIVDNPFYIPQSEGEEAMIINMNENPPKMSLRCKKALKNCINYFSNDKEAINQKTKIYNNNNERWSTFWDNEGNYKYKMKKNNSKPDAADEKKLKISANWKSKSKRVKKESNSKNIASKHIEPTNGQLILLNRLVANPQSIPRDTDEEGLIYNMYNNIREMSLSSNQKDALIKNVEFLSTVEGIQAKKVAYEAKEKRNNEIIAHWNKKENHYKTKYKPLEAEPNWVSTNNRQPLTAIHTRPLRH
ncbi:MAG: hypothetical protein K5769_00130 [Pseudobutyrivibrio sp.]|nr:hypothetical protein [Pseudobutyrivibrio sp.]